MLYQISYELKNPSADYTSLFLAIKKLGEWAHPLETVWFVNTSLSLSDVSKALVPFIDAITDKIVITETKVNGIGGRASTEFWKWIKNNYDV